MIQQREIRGMRTSAGILAREVAKRSRIENGRFSLIEAQHVTARPDELERIEKALFGLMGKRLTVLRSLLEDRGVELARA